MGEGEGGCEEGVGVRGEGERKGQEKREKSRWSVGRKSMKGQGGTEGRDGGEGWRGGMKGSP